MVLVGGFIDVAESQLSNSGGLELADNRARALRTDDAFKHLKSGNLGYIPRNKLEDVIHVAGNGHELEGRCPGNQVMSPWSCSGSTFKVIASYAQKFTKSVAYELRIPLLGQWLTVAEELSAQLCVPPRTYPITMSLSRLIMTGSGVKAIKLEGINREQGLVPGPLDEPQGFLGR